MIIHIIAQLKWNPLMKKQQQQQQTLILTLVKELMTKILNLKLILLPEYQNVKLFLETFKLQIGRKKFLWLKKLKILFQRHMLLIILMTKGYWNLLRKIATKAKWRIL